jgi:uncharacterized protein YjdB
MKKILLLLTAAFIILSSCNNDITRILESISIVNKIDELTIGELYTLNAEFTPAEIDEVVSIEWESSNQSAIWMGGVGYMGTTPTVTAIAKGEAKITLTVTVERNGEPVTFSDDVTIQVVSAE